MSGEAASSDRPSASASASAAAAPTDRARRTFLVGAAALTASPVFIRDARAADAPRFGLGVASGQPHPGGMVLWTRLTGDELPAQVSVRWEIADDEQFRHVVAQGDEIAEVAWAHSVHAEPVGLAPARWYWYRFSALDQQSASGRTRTAPAADAPASFRFVISSCQRWDVGFYAAWRHVVAESPDVVFFLGDYIYEYASKHGAVRHVEGGKVRTLDEYRARYATHKSDPLLQAAHAAAPWLLVWDDHEVSNDYADMQAEDLETDFPARRAAAYRAYWEHMPFPKSARPVGPDMRIVGRLDWGTLARIHLVDDRQYRDIQVCPKPGRGGSNTVPLADCPALMDPKRSLLGFAQERWLAEGLGSVAAMEPAGPAIADGALCVEEIRRPSGGGSYWTDAWDGYPQARNRLLGVVAEKKVPGVVVLGGDVHSNYVTDLKPDFDDPASPVVASEFCGTSITSTSIAQSRVDAARPFNPHVHFARSDQRGYMLFDLDARGLAVALRSLDRATDPESGITTVARFVVDLARPGPVAV